MKTWNAYILDLARSRGLIRPLDLVNQKIPRVVMTRMVRAGQLVRVGRGLYALPDRQVSEWVTLAEVAARHPTAVVCLLSALRFHGLTTQAPFEIWIAIPNKARSPRMDYPPIRVVRFSGDALTQGVQEHNVDGVKVRITSVAKTVADCFKYRNKIGLDVAIEALKEVISERRASIDELWHFAGICRVANVMRPYMESLS